MKIAQGVLLIVEDDVPFATVMRRAFERREYRVLTAYSLEDVRQAITAQTPDYAIVDLKLPDGSGLECVKLLHEHDQATRIVVLTGFASIATAVEAIKLGACHYLAKPAYAEEIEATFHRAGGDPSIAISHTATTIKTREWEHIHETLVATQFNISETARRLGMYRRTLARKLEKRYIR